MPITLHSIRFVLVTLDAHLAERGRAGRGHAGRRRADAQWIGLRLHVAADWDARPDDDRGAAAPTWRRADVILVAQLFMEEHVAAIGDVARRAACGSAPAGLRHVRAPS